MAMHDHQALSARLIALVADLSGYDEADIATDATFLELGFDSLFLTQLATAFSREFGVPITFRQLFAELSTVGALAAHIAPQLSDQSTLEPSVAENANVEGGSQAQAVTIETPPAPIAASASAPIVAAPALSPDGGGSMAGVLAEQVKLMAQQLQVLQRLKQGEAGATEQAQPVPAPQPTSVQQAPKPAAKPQAGEPSTATKMPAGFGPNTSQTDGPALTRAQQAHIDRLVARYNKKTQGSKKKTQEDRAWHADPRTAAGFNGLWKEMVYPLVIKRSKGAYLWDIDGNQYVDILNGFGPNFFGHNAPFITQALREQLDDSYEVGPQTPRAGEAAKLLCELTGMDRVSWVNTGSEAVQAAIRISRTVTQRDKIVVFSGDYHGNFDEVLVRGVNSAKGRKTLPLAPGIPFDSVGNVIVLDYGEESALDVIRQHAGEIACVLVEPVQSRRPEWRPREFLHALRQLTLDEGIVLVFDEVITGFRIRPGGAQEYFGVEADLATYGKIIGGGMPIGVVAGRSKYMDTFDGGMWQYGDDSRPTAGVTFFAGTFVRHPLAIAAAHASLQYLKTAGPALQEGINKKATRLADSLNALFQERGLNFEMPHFASQMFIRNREENELATLLFYHMRARGVHVLEGFPSYMTAAHTEEDVDFIIDAVREGLDEMQADGVIAGGVDGAGTPLENEASDGSFFMNDSQRRIWIASHMGDDASCAFNESDSIYLDGDLDETLFEEAVLETVERHQAFRLRFDADGEMQGTDQHAQFELNKHDLSQLNGEAQDAATARFFEQQAQTVFDLADGPTSSWHLLKLADDRRIFVLYCHHIVFDGYSAQIVVNEIMERYRAKVSVETYTPSQIASYSDYLADCQSTEGLARAERSTAWWREQFADAPADAACLPADRPRDDDRQYDGATLVRRLDGRLRERLVAAAKSIGVSQNTLIFAAYGLMTARLCDESDLIIGMPAAGQLFRDIETIGYCVNMLPLRVQPRGEKSFADYARDAQSHILDAFDHQDFSQNALFDALRPDQKGQVRPLTDIYFNYSRYFSDIDIPNCKVRTRENKRYAVDYDLFLNVIETADELGIYADYSSALFDEGSVDRWIDYFTHLLEQIADNPKLTLSELSAKAVGGDRIGLIGEITPLSGTRNVADLIAAASAQYGDKRALYCAGVSLSYAELEAHSNQLAHYLIEQGVKPGAVVGVYFDRSVDMVTAMLAIWKAGAAWLPLDPNFPHERLAFMVEDSGAELILTHREVRGPHGDDKLPARCINLDDIDDQLSRLDRSRPFIAEDADTSCAYVLYTSGSTGKPKGVENTHGATVNFLSSMKRLPGASAEDRLLAVTTISFDIAILELFLPLSVGAEVVIASRDEILDGYELCDLIEEHDITMLQATPVTWCILLECDWAGKTDLKALCGGEALTPDLAAKLAPLTAELWNMYGPTETTIWSSCEHITDPGEISVGAPIENTSFYILNDAGEPTPAGAPGNLWIGGRGVARGYLNRPELNTARFRDDRFTDAPGFGKIYDTGDRAVLRVDGKVDILGRRDNQVKVRGFRIELGEIEAALAKHEAIDQVAVGVHPDAQGEAMLVGYISWAAGNHPSDNELRQWLRRVLPDYMTPQLFVELARLPLTNNGKIDRNALPAPEAGVVSHQADIEPRTDVEKIIASLWRDLLDADKISVTDNFYELGGQSLQVVRMAAMLRKLHGYKISPRAVMFETLEQLAAQADKLAS